MLKRLFLLLSIFIPYFSQAQKSVDVSGMRFEYELHPGSLTITLTAPTNGWVGVGFNSKNNIVGSDLLLFHVLDGQADGLDMYVRAIGDPKIDQELGGKESFKIINAEEKSGHTKVKFNIPIKPEDQFDFEFKPGQEFWLILAYSTHDEFDHHSRMREHIPFRIEN